MKVVITVATITRCFPLPGGLEEVEDGLLVHQCEELLAADALAPGVVLGGSGGH